MLKKRFLLHSVKVFIHPKPFPTCDGDLNDVAERGVVQSPPLGDLVHTGVGPPVSSLHRAHAEGLWLAGGVGRLAGGLRLEHH